MQHPDRADKDDKGQSTEGGISVGVDVWMTGLVDLQHDQEGDRVHEGGIELEEKVCD